MKNFKLVRILLSLCCILMVPSVWAMPDMSIGSNLQDVRFKKEGVINLTNYHKDGSLLEYLYGKIKIITGSEFIKIKPYPNSNVSDYSLNLSGQDNKVAVIIFDTTFTQEGYVYPGSCQFVFDNVTSSEAHFRVVNDSSFYGCGINDLGYISVNYG